MKFFKINKENIKRIIFVVITIISIILFFVFKLNKYFTYDNVEQVRLFIIKMSFWGPLFIIFLFIAFNMIGMPNVFFVFLSSYLYGLYYGIILGHIGTIFGFTVSFLCIRFFFRNAFVKKYGNKKIVKWIERHTEESKGWSVLFLRIIFAIPYSAQNIAYALTSISFTKYFVLSVIGSIPQTLLFAYLGYIVYARQINNSQLKNILLIIVLIITVFASIYFTYLLIEAKKKKISS